jgi:hypothetical protein
MCCGSDSSIGKPNEESTGIRRVVPTSAAYLPDIEVESGRAKYRGRGAVLGLRHNRFAEWPARRVSVAGIAIATAQETRERRREEVEGVGSSIGVVVEQRRSRCNGEEEGARPG